MAVSALDEFCGSPFWNTTLTWDTEDPDFTICFEKTVLVWVPCIFLWILSSLEIFYVINSKNKNIPWNFLNIAKLLVTVFLIILSIVDLSIAIKHSDSEEYSVHGVDIYTPVIKILTFALSALFLIYNRKHGLRTSGVQFLFWFLIGLFGAPQFRTEILSSQRQTPDLYYFYISYLIYYPLVLLMIILNCFADKAPVVTKYPKSKKPCPEEGASFLSRIFYQWFDIMAWRGFRNPLKTNDLWDLKHEDTAQEVFPRFDKYWQETIRNTLHTPQYPNATFKSDSARVTFVSSAKKKHASILPALCKTVGPTFLFGSSLKLIQDILTFVSPQVLNLLIEFVEQNEAQWKGFLYVGLLFATASLQTLVLSQYFHRMFIVGIRIRTALISAIYRKALRMSNSARKESTVGEIVNLMSVDAQKFVELTPYLNMIWSAPLQIVLALYFLWQVLGASVLAGLAVMIVLIPVNGVIANRGKTLQIRQMKNKDERVKLMNEVLSGIKVLKLYAWEPSFEAQVLKIRDKEIKVLKQAAYLNAGTSFIWSCAPFLVSLVSFGTYVLVDETHELDAKTAFVSLSLFNVLRFPLSMLPMMISNMVQTFVSIKRLNKFMNCEELDSNNVLHDPSLKTPIVVEGATFSWGEEPILKDINLKFEKGNLTAVVGSVGSGKSSLVSALLGEMDKVSGKVNTIGQIAYVSQQAWIQNATLQDNILFGKALNQKLYDSIIDACALRPDFEMLSAGDQTEIVEKGINLSGGQKQRVSLARAVYSKADIYLLDDPLSAVDSHVGKHIFEQVVGPNGLLKKSTRVLVTHGITYLSMVDKIIVLKDGSVSEIGTYKELLDRKGAFSEFIIQHLHEVEEESQLSGTVVADEFKRQLSRHRSRISESISEAGSEMANGSLQHQKSVDSSSPEKTIRRRTSSNESTKKLVVGEKLIEAEKAETGSVKWEVYVHYLKSIGVFLSLSTILLNVLFQFFTVGSSLSIAAVFADLAPTLGCWYAARVMHNVMLNGIMRAPLSFFDVTPSGRIIARFSKDVDVMDTSLPFYFSDGTYCFFEVLATLFVISYTTPIFIAVIIPIGIVYYLVQRFYVATSRQLKRLESVSRSPIYSHFGETVTGASAIRAYGQTERFINESEAKVDFNQVCYFPSIIANRWLAVRLEMVGNLIILFAALFAVLSKDQNSGLVGLSVTYALQITQTLNWLVRMTSDVETNIVAVERIKEYGETAQEAPWDIPNTKPDETWPNIGTVTFKDYAVRYRPGLDLVLKGINFTVNGGEKVGIVGRTGAGKSSLTLSLFRIIEAAQGEIIIDNVNISKIGLHSLRSRLTIIPQDAVLFSGSLRMNLDPFDNHSDEEIWRSLEHAHLKEFIKGLPSGLNHEVSEGGENLSVGQRQLICLSRALLRKTKVLILDEATAAVDLETDDLIQRTIRDEFKDCTVLTIAHRLNTIMDSDRVIVLDRGDIVEFDTPGDSHGYSVSIRVGMDEHCGSPFWDSSITWDSDNPDFTKCFEETVLVWIPCIFLWIFAGLDVYYIKCSQNKNIPWNFFNISKLALIFVLITLTLIDLLSLIKAIESSHIIYNVQICTPIIKILTWVLAGIFVICNRKYGIRTSGVQFLFWLLSVICGAPQFRSQIIDLVESLKNFDNYVGYLLGYVLQVILLVLYCFADKPAGYTGYETLTKPCPEEESSFLCRIFFQWFDTLAYKGFRQPLKTTDLWNLRHEDTSKVVFPKFDKYWEKSLKKAQVNFFGYGRAAFKSGSTQIEFVNSSTKKIVSILPSLCKAFGPTFLFGAILRLIQDLLAFVSPLILNLLLTYVQNRGPKWRGLLYVVCLFVAACVQTLILSQYFYRMHIVGIRIRTALISAIYRKSLRISSSAKKESSMGEIINLMQVDAQIFAELVPYINMVWSAPLQILISIYFLWQLLGVAVLAGVAVMIVLIPVNGAIVKRVQMLQLSQMKNKDDRIKLVNEVLNGIKVLKLYGWEPSFEEKIMKIRGNEIAVLKKAAYLNATMALIFSLAPFLVALLTFVTFVNLDETNILTPQRAFVSLTLFANMHFSMGVLPLVIVWIAESCVSVKRLNKFLNGEEFDPDNVKHDPSCEDPAVIKNGNFSWGEDVVLRNINLKCERGYLTAIVGRVGSGKSSLISALLGEMNKISGFVNTLGTIAYVSQQDWIQNATLQDNILFGKSLDKDFYNTVVETCALKQDFDMLPAGDQTEVGEKGINLSGGQKQRISLARAVYSKAQVYMFDDPLSAVDSHVGKHIFDKVIGPHGLLKHATRLFVTHNLTYLPQADKIIVMKDGEISENGTYQELMEKKGDFSEFLIQYLYKVVESGDEDMNELTLLLNSSTLPKEVSSRVLQSQMSVKPEVQAEVTKTIEPAGEKLIEEEKVEEGRVQWSVFMYYFKAIGFILTIATTVCHIMYQVYSVGGSIWLSIWSSHTNATIHERDVYLGVYAGLGLGQVLSMFLSAVSLYIGCLNGSHLLHNTLLQRIVRAPSNTFFDVTPIGRILNRFSKDIDVLDNSLPMIIKGWFNCFLSVFAILFVVSYTTPMFLVVVVPVGIIYYLIQRFYIGTSRQLKRLESITRSPIYSHFSESVAGASVLRAYGVTERSIKESEEKVDFNQSCNFPSIIAERWLSVRLEMVGNLIILFAALFAVLDENPIAGYVGLSIAYALQITQCLNSLVVMTSDIETNIVSVERIKEYGEINQEAAWDVPNKVVPITWPDKGVIIFKNFSFKYRPDLDLALKHINIIIKSGEKVGIVGRTGAGKSSLTLSLFRIIEAAEGEIIIDDISISQIGLQPLRSRLTIIPQDTALFSGSLRMNLDPYEKYNDDEVWLALEQAYLKEYVEGLPAGLNHEVTEGGENLSVGQRQLLCLSRALLRKSKVLILDEATSAVDLETDFLIQKTIRAEFRNCTILTIAHRLNTIMDSDRIVVLDKGSIAECDSPSNLLENKKSIFYSMCKDANLV
ncbi:hypothetical protein RN001_011462 [Aquatica leii]|uniref:ABC-type glutathione-S-conjugate transporter n=1 Tax=Aquatica leii TaxID=1421715 RepID=A0AAN7SP35_9COLE|nr:hypothetical protein RN001_011462 [Aquatica leii]